MKRLILRFNGVIANDRILRAKRESKHIEFKQAFDITAAADWCEIIKDIAAIANSGGGAIIFGADNKGQPVGGNVSAIAGLDPVKLTDKLHSYTGCHFDAFELTEAKKGKKSVAFFGLAPPQCLLSLRNLARMPSMRKSRR